MKTFPARRAAAQTGHIRFGRGFVEEDEAGWLEAALDPAPDAAGAGDVGPGLLRRAESLFLYVSPMSANT
jgi:hypothetical protein